MDPIKILKILDEYEVLNEPFEEISDDFLNSKELLSNYLFKNQLINEKKLNKFNEKYFKFNKTIYLKLKNFFIYGKTYPKFLTSGDFFGIFPLNDSRVVIFLSDVSGKGLEAGLLAFMLYYYLSKELNMTSVTPQILLKKINGICLEIFDELKFATFSLLILDLLSGSIEYAAAGSPPLLHYNLREQSIEEADTVNIPLGIEKDFIYKGKRLDFNKGDIILLYTDGAYEQMNRTHQIYGLERLKKSFKKNIAKEPKKIIRNLYWDLKLFSLFARPNDDTTYIIIQYLNHKK
ncbi:MAG: PP2C family protein-serine/threonine phosphatase [Leptonema sp. (in: bacteria)]